MYLPDTKQIARDIGATAVNHTWKSKNRQKKNQEKTHKNVAQQQLEMGVVVGLGVGAWATVWYWWHVVYLFVIRLFVLSFVCRLFVALDTYCK